MATSMRAAIMAYRCEERIKPRFRLPSQFEWNPWRPAGIQVAAQSPPSLLEEYFRHHALVFVAQ